MRTSQDELLRDFLPHGKRLGLLKNSPLWSDRMLYRRIALALLALVFATSIAASIVTAITSGGVKKTRSPRLDLHCGSTPEEARDLGCRFDVMEFAWNHVACWDQELLDEFAPYNRWIFALDETFEHTLSQEIVTERSSNGTLSYLWIRNDYHSAHCVYSFTKIAKAIAEKRPITIRNNFVGHAQHCGYTMHNLTNELTGPDDTGLAGIAYLSCQSSYPE